MPRSDPPGPMDSRAQRPAPRGCVALILQRFPNIQAVSLALLERHEAFRDLCEEYEVCTQTCERLELSNSDETLRREYTALQLRLESELLRYVEENSTRDQS